MSSNLKVNSLVPATGTAIGIGTTGGSIDFRCPATFGGNVTIGGTLTYDEVINIDSIGIVTARTGLHAKDDSTFYGVTSGRNVVWDKSENSLEFGDYTYAKFGVDEDLSIFSQNTLSVINNKTGELRIPSAGNVRILKRHDGSGAFAGELANFKVDGAVELFNAGNKKFETTNTGVVVTGILTATSFKGDGSALTGITQTTINNNANNRIITGSGTANTLEAEANLTYDGGNQFKMVGSGQQDFMIGSTNAGGAYLILDGDSNGDAIGADYSYIAHDTGGDVIIGGDNPNGDAAIIFKAGNNAEKIRITSDGDMGLGCTNPGADPAIGNDATVLEIRQTTSGNITSGNNRKGAVLRLKHEAQWENGYQSSSPNDDLGRVEFVTGDNSTGEGVRSVIRCRNLQYFNSQALTFEVATANSTSLEERLRIDSSGRIDILGDGGNDGFTLSNKYGQAGFFGGMYYNGSSWTRNATGARKGSGIYVNTGGHIVALTSAETSGTSATAVERFRLTQDGKVSMGLDAPTIGDATWYDDLVINNMSGGSGQPGGAGIQILSNSSSWGGLIFGDQTSSCQVGYLKYDHGNDKLVWGANSGERMCLDTVTISSTTSGVLGINDTSPAADALGLVVKNKGSQDSSLPVVLIQRDNNAGGGAGNDEIALKINMPYTYNNAGGCYGIKSYVVHNLNGLHYGGYFEARGSQYDAGGSGAGCYATIHKSDTNGPGYVPAFYAYARSTYNGSSTGYAVGMRIKLNAYEPNRGILIHHELTNSNWTRMISFHKGSGANGTEVGSIKSSNNATQYNTSSDYRLKENVVDLTGAITRLKQLKPKRFNFKNDTSKTVDGFIAHEVEPVVPQAVSGEKDAVKIETVADPETGLTIMNEDGTPKTETKIDPQEVDYSKLSTLTIAALQEALAKIETLEARINTLEGS